MTSVEARRELLAEASEVVAKDRNSSYGEPEDAFARIAVLWSAYLNKGVSRTDVAAMMVLMKVARIAHTPEHRDSWLDIAGYAACGWSTVVDDITTDPPTKS